METTLYGVMDLFLNLKFTLECKRPLIFASFTCKCEMLAEDSDSEFGVSSNWIGSHFRVCGNVLVLNLVLNLVIQIDLFRLVKTMAFYDYRLDEKR